MENINFTIIDIRKILKANYSNLFWTGKIYDEHIHDYRDLDIKDFYKRSILSFLFINRERRVCEKDIQISNSNFIIFNDKKFQKVEKDLSTDWINLLENNTVDHLENLWKT